MLKAGIIGLPNVGKSTLFNALTRSRKASAENYPFCTIEPNVGVVELPDDRLGQLAKIVKTNKIIPAAVEFVDIAGLVAGASNGEGLGNKFLANIREVDAIVHMVRCFQNTDIIHNMGSIDPLRDIEVINTELILADLQSIDNQIQKNTKKAKSGDKDAQSAIELLNALQHHLNDGNMANSVDIKKEDISLVKSFNLLTDKPVIYAENVLENGIKDSGCQAYISAVEDYVSKQSNARSCMICAQLEADLMDFSPEDAANYLEDLALKGSGISNLIRSTYDLLGLASYFTAGETEVRAWTFKRGMKAPQCAGIIHGDFEKGFIKAEVVDYADLIATGSYAAAKELGKYRLEGRDYEFRDGDIAIFRFNR
ncbi:MAG: redox-regulated ATPase YchF [Puniceicoccales bacterium]|jgi:GTP-binding protein YchF|nr:redox-regulated ATPase YchF [Puniceicoccales bacterium]